MPARDAPNGGGTAGIADPLTETSGPPGRTGHLGAVDVVRFVTVAGVILVHATALTISYGSVAAGAVLDVFHVTRAVFLLLSAFVLTYSYEKKPLAAPAFWRRRYPLVVVPYATWSLIYVLTDGDLRSPGHTVGTFLYDLLTGGAHFHLYFLLLTMQMYLLFPALMVGLRRRPHLLAAVLVGTLAAQLLFSSAVHYGFWPPVLGIWFRHTSTWLLSYPVFVVAGIAAAHHFDRVTGWVRTHYRLIALAWIGSVAVSLSSYLADLDWLGYSPLKAGEVFQPAVTLAALTATAGQYALGIWLFDRLPVRHRRRLEASSDVSFGVYLAHPLIIGATLDVAVAGGVWAGLAHIPSGLGETLVALGLVPFVYATTFAAVWVARRTPLSLALTGRRQVRGGAGTGPPHRQIASPQPVAYHPPDRADLPWAAVTRGEP